MNICSFTTVGDQDTLLSVSVSAVNRGVVAKIILAIEAENGERDASGVEVQFEQQKMTVDGIDLSQGTAISRIIAKGMGCIVQEILMCKHDGMESPLTLIKHLQKRGHVIGSGITKAVCEE